MYIKGRFPTYPHFFFMTDPHEISITMLCRVLLLSVSAVWYIQQFKNPIAEIAFPDDIQSWCPPTKFCDLEPAQPLNVLIEKNETAIAPCCKICSCANDCGLKRECCREHFDAYRLDETVGTICKPLNTKRFSSRDDDVYYVVEKCPDRTESCRSLNASTWGTYSPVYSTSTSRIYYNIHCAKCHNISNLDIVAFIPTLTCTSVYEAYWNIFSRVMSGVEDPECFLQFLVPRGVDLTKEKCFPRLIRSCLRHFQDWSKFETICRSHNATFVSSTYNYGNVYCYVCNTGRNMTTDRFLGDHRWCPITDKTERLFEQASLIVVLSDTCVELYKESVAEPESTICIKTDTDEEFCRPVYCPEGHFRVNGECTVFGQDWFIKNVQLYVKLTPTAQCPKKDQSYADELSSYYKSTGDKSFIHRPYLKDWDVELFYNKRENETTLRYFLAVLFLRSQTIKPKHLLGNIDKSFRKRWKIIRNNETCEFKAEIDRYITYNRIVYNGKVHISSRKIQHQIDKDNLLLNITGGIQKKYRVNRQCITKLFYCQQVELDSKEISISNYDRLYLVNEEKYLESGEYVVSKYVNGKVESARVCLNDVISDTNASNSTISLDPVKRVLFLIFTKVFLIVLKLARNCV